MSRDVEIVIARYKEDLSWMNRLPSWKGCRFRVYNKDEGGDLPNIGREAHTYLHHIITYYDNLADTTVFLQGDPFAHCLYTHTHHPLPYEMLRPMLENIRFDTTQPFATCYLHTDDFGNEACNIVFGFLPTMIRFPPGAQWIVCKKDILGRPKQFYQRLMDELVLDYHNHGNKHEHVTYSINPWTLERLWGLIFHSDIPISPSFMMKPSSL